jgi:hypothetical protein
MQGIRDAVNAVAGFETLPQPDKLRFFAWALHAGGKEHLKPADFAACYDAVHLQQPGHLHRDLKALESKGDLLRSTHGVRLAKTLRDGHDAKYGNRPQTVQVHDILKNLSASVSSPDRREYLEEALLCCKAGAWRGAIIMSWNVAFDHLCEHIITKKLVDFNAVTSAWKKPVTIAVRKDLQELKENDVVTVCRTAGITDKTQTKCLDRNLGIRNDAAHPSGAKFDQLRAESFISEVVRTIVSGLS